MLKKFEKNQNKFDINPSKIDFRPVPIQKSLYWSLHCTSKNKMEYVTSPRTPFREHSSVRVCSVLCTVCINYFTTQITELAVCLCWRYTLPTSHTYDTVDIIVCVCVCVFPFNYTIQCSLCIEWSDVYE